MLAPSKSHREQRFKSYYGVADILTYFFERGVEVLRPGGRLAFITSGSWRQGELRRPAAKVPLRQPEAETMVDYHGDQCAHTAELYPVEYDILIDPLMLDPVISEPPYVGCYAGSPNTHIPVCAGSYLFNPLGFLRMPAYPVPR